MSFERKSHKIKTGLILLGSILFFALNGCSSNNSTQAPAAPASQVVSIGGGSITTMASNSVLTLTSQEILDNNDDPVVDGVGFIVTGSPQMQVSADGVNFGLTAKVTSVSAKISFFIKVPTTVGIYTITVTQSAHQQVNASGAFFVDVQPNVPDNLGAITSSRFEDVAPWTGVFQTGDEYSALADGQTPVQLSVGPIVDSFGNLLQSGNVRLLVSQGEINSVNPAEITDGFVFFTYLPTTTVGPVNVTAQAVDEAADQILNELNGVIFQVKPILAVTTPSALGTAGINTPTNFPVTIQNNGTTDVTALNIRTAQPFTLPFQNECPSVLHSGQSCQVTVQILSPTVGTVNGQLNLSGLPNTVPDTTLAYPISVNMTSPASISLSTNSVGFGPVFCGDSETQEIYVQNTGQAPATNFSVTSPAAINSAQESTCNLITNSVSCGAATKCRWFHPPNALNNTTDICTSRPFDLVLQPADTNPSTDPNVVINCGSTIPSGRKCRVQVVDNPKALFSSQSIVGRVQAGGLSPLNLTVSGSTVVGNAAGTFPITFNPPLVSLSTSATTTVNFGPVEDLCGNAVTNGVPFTASVTAGTLNETAGTLIGGGGTLIWTGSNSTADLGPQSITINAQNVTVNQLVNFTGSNLVLTGPTNVGEISVQSPQVVTWNLMNNGNGTASAITPSFSNLVGVTVSNINSSTCSSALVPGGSCSISATLTPSLGANQTVSFTGQLVVNSTGFGQGSVKTSFQGFGHTVLNLINGNVAYFLGNNQAGIPLSRTITLNNPNATTLAGLNVAFSGVSTGWSFSLGTCGTSLAASATCNLNISYTSTVSGIKTATLIVGSSTITTQINLSVNETANEPTSITAITPAQSAIPADGVSTDSINIGPILDLYGNVVVEGTLVDVTVDKGTIVEPQPLSTDVNGNLTATLVSSANQVGTATVKVQALTSTGTNSAAVSFKTITYSGINLAFSSNSLDFGSVPIGQPQDETITLTNTGNTNATGLSLVAADSSIFSIIQLGTCSTGALAAGSSCTITIRFTGPTSTTAAQINGTLTATSSILTGQNTAVLPLTAVNILPATLVADVSTVSVQLVPGQIYTTTVTLTNIGNAPTNNFLISSNNNLLTLGNFQGCNALAGGQSCTFTLAFNAISIQTAQSAIITASADNTSVNINFTSDFVHLAFINPNFTANVLTCHPIQVQAQDSSSNPMVTQTVQLLNLTSSRQGTFYTNNTCSGQTVAQIGIFVGNETSQTVYYLPKVAGKHTLTASEAGVSVSQDNLANIIVTPSNQLTVGPSQGVQFGAVGANGALTCTFVANNSGSQNSFSGGSCNYVAGPRGSQTDQILMQDSDTPPNTASIQATTTPAVSITPQSITVSSGGQVQFSASAGSGTGYVYSITPNSPTKKIGSSIFNNLYTAGQNITGTANLGETVTVTDSFGATATASVFVQESVFLQNQIATPPTKGQKNVAVWKNFMVVGDPQATATTTAAFVHGGVVHIYTLDSTTNPAVPVWKYLSSINSSACTQNCLISSPQPFTNGNFGSSVSIFNNQVVVGAPGEPANGSTQNSGAAYYFTLDSSGNPSGMFRITKRNGAAGSQAPENDFYGAFTAISGNYVAIGAPGDGVTQGAGSGVQLFTIGNWLPNTANAIQPLTPDSQNDTGPVFDSMALYSNSNYGGTYVALGTKASDLQGPAGIISSFGGVEIWKLQDDGSGNITGWSSSTGDPTLGASTLPGLTVDETTFVSGYQFGAAVSMYGPYLAVGAPGADNGKGRVYIFRRDPNQNNANGDNVWATVFTMKATDFNAQINAATQSVNGSGVTINTDGAGFGSTLAQFGNYLMIGAPTETNYSNLADSGGVYVFQRFLSDNNSWEYLGELKSTDYGSGDHFGISMSAYTNNFVISNTNATGNFYYYTGGKFINKWPFGYHGIFNPNTDYHQPEGTMRDWSSFTLNFNLNYIIDPTEPAAWSDIGVAGDMELNGTIIGINSPDEGMTTSVVPDVSGFDLGKTTNWDTVQEPGGSGATGNYGRNGTATGCGFTGYRIWGGTAQIGSPGIGQSDGNGGAGGLGGGASTHGADAGLDGSGDCCQSFSGTSGASCTTDSPFVGGSNGGAGGGKAAHGLDIYIESSNIFGQGSVQVNGLNGIAGSNGDPEPSNSAMSLSTGNQNDGDGWCEGDNCNATVYSLGGAGGGGGGGAGGSAGAVVVLCDQYFGTWSFNISGGIGGPSGSCVATQAGTCDFSAQAGTNGTSGVDCILQNKSQIRAESITTNICGNPSINPPVLQF